MIVSAKALSKLSPREPTEVTAPASASRSVSAGRGQPGRAWWSGEPSHDARPPDQLTHQPLDGAAGHRGTLPVQLPPDLPGAIDPEVLGVDPADLDLQFLVVPAIQLD
jgi:hypothetical protein